MFQLPSTFSFGTLKPYPRHPGANGRERAHIVHLCYISLAQNQSPTPKPKSEYQNQSPKTKDKAPTEYVGSEGGRERGREEASVEFKGLKLGNAQEFHLERTNCRLQAEQTDAEAEADGRRRKASECPAHDATE